MNIDQFQAVSNGISNPFSEECIVSVHIEIYPQRKQCIATIYFKNGATSGSHEIINSDYIELNKEIALFIDTLN